jgi:hypothetical protein
MLVKQYYFPIDDPNDPNISQGMLELYENGKVVFTLKYRNSDLWGVPTEIDGNKLKDFLTALN